MLLGFLGKPKLIKLVSTNWASIGEKVEGETYSPANKLTFFDRYNCYLLAKE